MDAISRLDPVDRAREVGPIVAAASDTIERERRLSPGVLDALHEARLFRMLLPRAYGGDEVHPVAYLHAVEEISRHDGSVGWCLFQACSTSLIAAFMEPEAARTVFGPERASVAWGPPAAPEANAVPGGYRVSGTWHFASGSHHATWMGVHCPVREAGGGLRLNGEGRPLTRSLLFPAENVRFIDVWDTIGLRGTASDSYALQDLFVPEAFSATREDMDARRVPGLLYSFSQQGIYAIGSAAVALGLAGAMLERFVALAAGKSARGVGSLARSAVVQTQIAQAAARLAAARAYQEAALHAAWGAADEGVPLPLADRARMRLASLHAIEVAAEVADYAYKAAGADAIFPENGFERRFRDMHTLTQQIQARLANYEPIGRVLLGVESEPGGMIL